MTTFARAYFSFLRLSDPTAHRKHNDWHQLTHMPENRLLPGVAWGERWVRSPQCAASSRRCSGNLDGTEYVTMYLLRAPADVSRAAFFDLASHALQIGDRPELQWWGPHIGGFFVPIRGYVGPHVRVAADALPLRPGHGIYITVRDIPPDSDHNTLFRVIDTVSIPHGLDADGVAGAWTFVNDDAYLPFPATELMRRVTIYFLDEDPIAAAAELDRVENELSLQFPATSLVFSSPLLTITPHQWDWFDDPTT